MKRLRFKILLLLLPALAACAVTPPKSALSVRDRQAVDASRAIELGAAVEAIAQKQATLSYLSAYAQVSMVRGKERRFFDAVLQVAPPNRLSLQVLNEFGQEIASVIADGEEVRFRDFQNGDNRRYLQNDKALSRTLRLPLTVEDLVDRILLRLPASETLLVERENVPEQSPAHWIVRREDALRVDLKKEPRLRRYEAVSPGKKWRYRVDYADYAPVDSLDFPRHIALHFRKPALSLNLNLQQISFAPPASRGIDSNFDIKNH